MFSMCFTASSSKKICHRVISDNEVDIGASHPNTTMMPRQSSPSDVDLSEAEQEAPKPTMKDHLHDIDAFFDESITVVFTFSTQC